MVRNKGGGVQSKDLEGEGNVTQPLSSKRVRGVWMAVVVLCPSNTLVCTRMGTDL